jgi:hypothetical protein
MKLYLCVLGFAILCAAPAVATQTRVPPRVPATVQRQAPPLAQAQPPAQAQPVRYPTRVTAKALSAVCSENNAACLTYVLGVVDAYVATTIASFGQSHLCFPPQVSNQQIANVAIAYLHAHPEQQDANAATAVILGIQAAYPCRQGAAPQ